MMSTRRRRLPSSPPSAVVKNGIWTPLRTMTLRSDKSSSGLTASSVNPLLSDCENLVAPLECACRTVRNLARPCSALLPQCPQMSPVFVEYHDAMGVGVGHPEGAVSVDLYVGGIGELSGSGAVATQAARVGAVRCEYMDGVIVEAYDEDLITSNRRRCRRVEPWPSKVANHGAPSVEQRNAIRQELSYQQSVARHSEVHGSLRR